MSPGERFGIRRICIYLNDAAEHRKKEDSWMAFVDLVAASNTLLFLAGRVPSDECARRLAGLESAIDVLFRRMG
jgi:hypothetical protein